MSTTNYSIFAIPAYMILTMVPHIWSVVVVTSYSPKSWDNTSPRATTSAARIEKAIPRKAYAKYERLRAAHNNMFDNMGFVVGGILAGNMAELKAGWLNQMCLYYLLSRVVYIICYAQIDKVALSSLRSVVYNVGSVLIAWLYWDAGWVFAKRSQL